MTNGYFIGLGDKTTCGGRVLEGDPRVNIYGLLHAREGGDVTCGKNRQTYTIVGGVSHIISHGKRVAGTLDSFSSCPCQARLLPSVFTASYSNSNEGLAPHAARRAAEPAPAPVTRRPQTPAPSSFTPSSHPAPVAFNSVEPQEPGFYVVPKSMTREALESMLFPVRDPAVMSKFKALNPNLSLVKAGSMIVLSDPNNYQCAREQSILMEAAAQTNDALAPSAPMRPTSWNAIVEKSRTSSP